MWNNRTRILRELQLVLESEEVAKLQQLHDRTFTNKQLLLKDKEIVSSDVILFLVKCGKHCWNENKAFEISQKI